MNATTQPHPLQRSRRDHIVAGVCGGLAEFFGINVLWFRLAFLIALIHGDVRGLGLSLLLWLIIQEANDWPEE